MMSAASGVQHIRLRRPEPVSAKPQPRHTGILQDQLRRAARRPWNPSFSLAVRILLLVRFAGAMYSNIDDCDEVFNFWEPLHFLDHGYGFQTWEVSPQFAIRSWAYILLHLLPARISRVVGAGDKRIAFFAVRISLATVSVLAEAKFYRTVYEKINERVGRYLFFMMLSSAGMWNASAALLPSSFAMYTTTFAFSYALAPASAQNNHRTLAATVLFATGAIVGWPFALALAIPFVFEELLVFGADRVAPELYFSWMVRRWKRLFSAGLTASLVFIPVVLIDSIAYGKLAVVPWNIVKYNIFGGTDRGPELYGTSPWNFYLLNLALNFNVLTAFAVLSLPSLAITYIVDRKRLGLIQPSADQSSPFTVLALRLAPFYLWTAILTAQPHKEERFMFPAYPLLCFNAAVTLYLVRGWLETAFISVTKSPYRASQSMIFRTFTLSVVLASGAISVSRILALTFYYHSPMTVVYNFQAQELPRLLNETGLLPVYPPDTPEEDIPRIDLSPVKQFNLTLCVGKEWYRFPGHYLVPDGVRVDFVKSEFDGLLPGHFGEGELHKADWGQVAGWWSQPASWYGWYRSETRLVPAGLNDLNREQPSFYVSTRACDYMLDLDLPKHPRASQLEPRYAVDSKTWDRVHCVPFLDAAHSNLLTRTLWLPGNWQSLNEYGDYCLLRNRQQVEKKEKLIRDKFYPSSSLWMEPALLSVQLEKRSSEKESSNGLVNADWRGYFTGPKDIVDVMRLHCLIRDLSRSSACSQRFPVLLKNAFFGFSFPISSRARTHIPEVPCPKHRQLWFALFSSPFTPLSFVQTELPDDDEMQGVQEAPIHELAYERLRSHLDTLKHIIDTTNVHPTSREEAERTVKLLEKEIVPLQHKVAIIGRTGAGKSTLVNALLGSQLLSASASGACTAVATEISYKNIKDPEAVVEFITAEQWEKDLGLLLEDVKDTTIDLEEDTTEQAEAFSPSYQAKEKLIGIYPQIVQIPAERWNAEDMLQDSVVNAYLGTEKVFHAGDSQNFQKELEQFLASAFTSNDSRALWPLVKRVRIMGAFEVLSTGITLVDLPGYGDADNARDRMASEYLTTADAIFAGITRAKDDREIHSHLHKHLNQLILDGRVRDKSISLVLTGADSRIGSNEITLTPKEQSVVDSLKLQAIKLGEDVEKLRDKKRKKEQSAIANQKKKADALKKYQDQLQTKAALKVEKTRTMNNLLAIGRAKIVKSQLKSKYTEIYEALSSSKDKAVPNIPIFCLVGSRDYLCCKGLDPNEPDIFFDEKETEVPGFKEYLQNDGERRTLQAARTMLALFCGFLVGASTAKEPIKTESKDQKASKNLGAHIDALERNCTKAIETLVSRHDAAYRSLGAAVKTAVQQAEEEAPGIFDKLEEKKWNQYRSMMRQMGHYEGGNLNEDLTHNILPAISKKWNDTVNATIPLNNVNFREEIKAHVLSFLRDIARLAPNFNQKSLALEGHLDQLEKYNLVATSSAQRLGTRAWESLIEQELTPQYNRISAEKGSGMYKRMKSNHAFIRASAPQIFGKLNTYIADIFGKAVTSIRTSDTQQMNAFFRILRMNLVGASVAPKANTGDALQVFAASHEEECEVLLDKVKERLQVLTAKLA
ncbi:Glycosyltransferase family 22 protein [Mycena indigotica]|uniref:Glycosyltransferase family 22 protein n=1 Tax=Mycena indigotica TaxID=2126181 RepID=A0A8H6WCA4_9AGAR|nr:Glycosyltransferase family 22 protein [Mycena indigotica]KAF7307149.1 Glycosyltransferase family 22 protein [Mycena indigotica]